mgnify:CR=1
MGTAGRGLPGTQHLIVLWRGHSSRWHAILGEPVNGD